MKNALVIQYLLIVFLISSCVTIYNKDKLSINKLNDRNIQIIKTQGIYVAKQEKSFLPLVLFDNGYFHMNFSYNQNPTSANSTYLNQLQSNSIFDPKNRKYGIWGWGVWWTEGDSIFMEHYVNRAGNCDLNYYKGSINSDTTFNLKYRLGTLAKTDPLEFTIYQTELCQTHRTTFN